MEPRPLADLIAREAERLLKEIHHTDFTDEPLVEPKTGTYKMNDATFVALLLERVAPERLAGIRKSSPDERLRASDVCEFFFRHSHRRWHHVHSLEDAGRGDLIAWQLPRTACCPETHRRRLSHKFGANRRLEGAAIHGQSGGGPMLPATVQFIIATVGHAIHERMARRVDYLHEEVRVLKEALAAATGRIP